MSPSKPHWLTPTTTTKTPSVVVAFDTETSERDEVTHTVQLLRCWDAVVRVRHDTATATVGQTWHRGETSPALADVVEWASTLDREAWVIAHNVGFDLSVTSLPFILSERGWALDGVHLGDESCWWVLKRDDRRLVITDSWSWLRCPLDEAAHDMGRRKVKLPKATDELERWHRRSRHDVEILDQAITTVMNWWDDNELGVFGITGAACGWRALRSKTPPRRLLVGPDGARTDYERKAVYGGMKDVYGVGEFHDSWIADYDFVAAYPTTAAAYPLPLAPAKPWCDMADLLTTEIPPQRDYIAEVEITTRVPCAPVRIDGEIWRPVGTFRTTLAGPEVRYAVEVADSVRILSWQPYRLGFALAEWAAWNIDTQTNGPGNVPPIVSRIAKGWGRSVIGRFASRTSRVIATRPSTHLGWHLETGHDMDTGKPLEWLSMGGVEKTIVKDVDGSDVFPAVLAFVEAHTRVALSRVIATRPPNTVLQCNTDGWWEMHAVRRSTYVPEGVPWPYTVVCKALERRLVVRGPNHVLTPSERRYAGIPHAATSADDITMQWHDWPGLRWQLEHGEQGQYHRPARSAALAEHYVKRWVLDTGETIPVTTDITDTGETVVLPWSQSWGRRGSDNLSTYQVQTLAVMRETDNDPDVRVNVVLPDQPGRGFTHTPLRVGRTRSRRSATVTPTPNLTPEPLMHLAEN